MSATSKSYLAFVPRHTPSEHEVLAMIDHGDGPEAESLASFSDAPSATMLASALNGYLLHQVTAERRLEVVLDGAPTPVRTAVSALLPILAAATADDPAAPRVARQLPTVGDGGVLLFPTTNCPGQCEFCGTCGDDCLDCPECADGGCEICLPVTLAPRTAAVLGHALAILADEAYDHVYQTGLCQDGVPGPLGAVLRCVADQDQWFLRRYARAFDDLSSDLQVGRHPTPTCFPGKTSCCRAPCCALPCASLSACHQTSHRASAAPLTQAGSNPSRVWSPSSLTNYKPLSRAFPPFPGTLAAPAMQRPSERPGRPPVRAAARLEVSTGRPSWDRVFSQVATT